MASARHPWPCVALPPERLGYVQCSLCTTILLVSVPRGCLLTVVPVQCGHCAGVFSVALASLPASSPSPPQELGAADLPLPPAAAEERECSGESPGDGREMEAAVKSVLGANKPPATRQRTPTAYNCFVKEEIKRIKAMEPDITHKAAFGAAAKNWARLTYPESSRRETEGSAAAKPAKCKLQKRGNKIN